MKDVIEEVDHGLNVQFSVVLFPRLVVWRESLHSVTHFFGVRYAQICEQLTSLV